MAKLDRREGVVKSISVTLRLTQNSAQLQLQLTLMAQFLHPQTNSPSLEEVRLLYNLNALFQVGQAFFEHVESTHKLVELNIYLLLKAHAHVIVRDKLHELVPSTVL